MASQMLSMRTDKRLSPAANTPLLWEPPYPTGFTYPTISAPVEDGDYYKWSLEVDFDGAASQQVKYNFIGYSNGWDCVFSPYTSSQPDGMYFSLAYS